MGKQAEPRSADAIAGVWPAELERPFQLIVFDWDGTAVTDRRADGTILRERLVALLEARFVLVIVTGTHIGHITRQLQIAGHMLPERRLYAATNRGSEIYGFDAQGHPERLMVRLATPFENERLDAIAKDIRQQIGDRTGLEISIVFDRMNRRKIDLIPLEAWRDPPKAAIGKLIDAVQQRFRAAGVADGLAWAMELARASAAKGGLPDARITSDAKHIEVGLTDKGDAMGWVSEHLLPALGLSADDMLVAGDEFGVVAGMQGSDSQLMTPQVNDATFITVGPEPGRLPAKVLHLGGGPDRFLELLAAQTTSVVGRLPSLFIPNLGEGWYLLEKGHQASNEHVIESRFALSNGYAGSRGALAESGPHARSSTFLAGVFDPDPSDMPELVVAPDWRSLKIDVLGEPLRLDIGHILLHRRFLDLRRGLLLRVWRHRSPLGRITRVHEARWLSLSDRHTFQQRLWLQPENYSGPLIVSTGIEAGVRNLGGHAHWHELSARADPWPQLRAITRRSGVLVSLSAVTLTPETPENILESARLQQRLTLIGKVGEALAVDRCAVVYTSREAQDPQGKSDQRLHQVLAQGLDALAEAHGNAWQERWEGADVRIEGDEAAQLAIRFALYHLIGAANPDDERVSIGARALTGEAYKGHVFWDTEIYLLPFYIHTHPQSARALLMYRYHCLEAARQKARDAGYRGALYAWEAADTGAEVSPKQATGPSGETIPILTGRLEHHVSADVGHAIWQYWQATGDDAFLCAHGAEMILEIARFWATRAEVDKEGYHIRRVIGPDEYHEGIDDSAYTNVMARWILERAQELAALLKTRWPQEWERMSRLLTLSEQEMAAWRSIAERLITGFDPATQVFEEFAGYSQLDPIDLAAYDKRTVPMDVLLGHERIARTQVIKQADVLMLFHTLREQFPPAVQLANYRYYEPRTGHGSSLSPGAHALVAARLGLKEEAMRYFHWAAAIDLDNRMGNTSFGVHIATLGCLWQVVVFGFAGVHADEAGVSLNPQLPESWSRLAFPFRHRAWQLKLSLSADELEITVAGPEPLPVRLVGSLRELAPGIHLARRQEEDWVWQTGT